MGVKTPGEGPGCFKYAKFFIFDETLQPQKFVPGTYVQNSPQPHS